MERYATDERDRERLAAAGYEPVEVWVRPEDKFWDDALAEAREIAAADDETELDLAMETNLRELSGLIDEQETGERSD